MKYVALFRGINVGKSKRIDMKMLKGMFERIGCLNVSTYINSGNVLFESNDKQETIVEDIENMLLADLGEEIKVLVKTQTQMTQIANSIPDEWVNDGKQKTDVAYLFQEINREDILEELPIKKEFLKILFVDGAIIWNVIRNVYNKSHLNKIIGHKLYKLMTVRNVNTARYLATKIY